MINEIKYLELLKENKIEELVEKLEEEIRKSGALKTNSKSRYSALKRIEKRNERMSRNNLKGYGVKDNKYWFTDSYIYAVLNDNCNFEENKVNFPIDNLYRIDQRLELEKLYITIEDLSYYIKTKKYYKNDYFGNITFDYNYLKDCIDIIGSKDIKIYTNQDKNMLIFLNKDNERVILIGCKNY